MVVLVTGGAASGKSEYAEQVVMRLDDKKVYLATMHCGDKEDESRVQRHRNLRAGKGFITIEREVDLVHCDFPSGYTVLLECLSNLLSNEMFSDCGAGMEHAKKAIMSGIDHLIKQTNHLVIVSNEIFSDGIDYDDIVLKYQKILGELNQYIAQKAELVIEVVCGIPIILKQEDKNGTLAVV